MKPKKAVTVVIPVYNGEKYIQETLDSIVNQSFTDWSCLIIDDGSTDNSLTVINEFIELHQGLSFSVIATSNRGPGAARNLGIENSNSLFIALLDQDDLWDKTKLEKQINFLKENSEFNGVLCNFTISNFNNRLKLGTSRLIRNKDLDRLAKGWLSLTGNGALLSSTFLFRRNEYTQKILFDPQFSYVSDLDYFLTFNVSNGIAILKDPLVTYLHHGTQMHSDSTKMRMDYPKLLEKWDVEQFGFSRDEVLGNMYALCMLLEFRNGKLNSSIGLFRCAFNSNKKSLLIIPLSVFKKRLISFFFKLTEWI